MIIEKNIYDKIREIISEPHERVGIPQIKERKSYEIVGGKTLLIDIPKKEKIFYHGSNYTIDCDEKDKKCHTRGELVTVLKTGDDIKKKLEDLTCDILAIHNHDSLTVKSTHVHFRCENKDYDGTLKITKFLKEY